MKTNQPSCKIYSRNRLKIFKPKENHRHFYGKNYYLKNNKKLYLFFIILIACITFVIIYNSADPIFESICLNEAKAIATRITNDESTNAVKVYQYSDLFSVQKDDQGNIQMINANILTIDLLTSDIASFIQNSLDNAKSSEVKMPIGSFLGIKMLSRDRTSNSNKNKICRRSFYRFKVRIYIKRNKSNTS